MTTAQEVSLDEFERWFKRTFPLHLFPEGEDREELETYTWLAWRDSQRLAGQPARKGGE